MKARELNKKIQARRRAAYAGIITEMIKTNSKLIKSTENTSA